MSLGVILTPYGHTPGYPSSGIAYSFKGSRDHQTPFDPQWYRRGEAGYYYDSELGGATRPSAWQRFRARVSGLGAIPTDFEIAKSYGYLPVYSGWVTTNQGYQSGGWNPPHGRWPGYPTAIAPRMAPLNGLGATEVVQEPIGPTSIDDFVAVQQAQNDRVFALTAVSTVAVTISALIGLFRTIKLIKEDK